mgnify:CR=1 FL=1
MSSKRIKVLFVCMGNICRSPTAQGVFAEMVRREGLAHLIHIDSAGTHAYHVGEPPDTRAQAAAANRGIDLSDQRARRVHAQDFDAFDYVLPMDSSNYEDLEGIRPSSATAILRRFLDYAPHVHEQDVPDPYYGGPRGFERVLDLIEAGSEGLLLDIRARFKL